MEREIEYESVSGKWIKQLTALFDAIIAKGEDCFFHPHPTVANHSFNSTQRLSLSDSIAAVAWRCKSLRRKVWILSTRAEGMSA